MGILTIREHSRFAVCSKASVRSEAGRSQNDVLLIEVSKGGCRLGNVRKGSFAIGEMLSVHIGGDLSLTGLARWAGDGSLGLKLSPPLHRGELDALVRLCRGDGNSADAMRA